VTNVWRTTGYCVDSDKSILHRSHWLISVY